MKSHFGRQVLEKPRHGSRDRGTKTRHFGEIVDGEYYGLTRIPMNMNGRQRAYYNRGRQKSFTDVIGPLKGYLRSSVGRPWDDVYSELSRELGGGPWPMRHIFTKHLDVAVNTYRGVDGHVWHNDKRGGPEIVTASYQDEYYVHPETRTLRVMKRSAYWSPPRAPQGYAIGLRKEPERPVDLSDGRSACLVYDIWFIGRYEFVPDRVVWVGFVDSTKYDMGHGKIWQPPPRFVGNISQRVDTTWPDYQMGDGRMVFTKIKQANKRELKVIHAKLNFKSRQQDARK